MELGDGLFEVILVKNPRNLAEAANVASELLTKNIHSQYVIALHSRRVRFTFNHEVTWTLDGEAGGAHSDVTLINPHTPVSILV